MRIRQIAGSVRLGAVVVLILAGLLVVVTLSSSAGDGPGGARAESGGGGTYIFSGRGRAHGVGMCMDGVYYMARAGYGYRDILSYYYTNVEFSTTDESRPIRVKCSDGVVRTYPMNEYLYRLAEEPESFPAEGLRALMVAARTYVLSCIARGKHTDEGYDVCSSGSCCQAFNHELDPATRPNNKAAVDATGGVVLTYDGKIITAAYCGSCGGHTENNEDVWGGNPIPYLRGRPCEWCKNSSRFSWKVAMSAAEVESRLNAHQDSKVGSLRAIDLSERTPGGRIKRARLVGSEGVKYISGTVFYGRLGLSSSLVEILPDNFDEYLLVCNTNEEATTVTFTFMQPSGEVSSEEVDLSANSRFTLPVDDYLQYHETSAVVSAEDPVIAERAMYFDYHGKQGGHSSSGVPGPATKWYLPEGCTGWGFDTYLLVQNPQPTTSRVRLTFMTDRGESLVREIDLAGRSRLTVGLDAEPGLGDTSVSTVVESTNEVPVVVERAMYFDWQGRIGGHVSPGADSVRDSWYFAEGYTGGDFDTFFMILNPGDDPISVKGDFIRADGGRLQERFEVGPRSRFTVWSDRIDGLEDAEFSTLLSSDDGSPFVAERSVYFDYGGITGGHDCLGVEGPGESWYLAEGYTGGDFDTFVLLANFEEEPASAQVTFMRPGGERISTSHRVPAGSRATIRVDDVPGLESAEFSTRILCSAGDRVVAERAEYFRYLGRSGGHSSPGISSPACEWFFAEGYTGE